MSRRRPAPPVRPDALPVSPVASHATLSSEAAARLFGTPSLGPAARVEVLQGADVVARVPVSIGDAVALTLGAADASPLSSQAGLRLQGPLGSVEVEAVQRVPARLEMPERLAQAWGVPTEASVQIGALAVGVARVDAPETRVVVDRAVWCAAGRPATARWVPSLDLTPPAAPEAREPDAAIEIPRRVVTETDVRQAILRKRPIRIHPTQIVTPAARELLREHPSASVAA